MRYTICMALYLASNYYYYIGRHSDSKHSTPPSLISLSLGRFSQLHSILFNRFPCTNYTPIVATVYRPSCPGDNCITILSTWLPFLDACIFPRESFDRLSMRRLKPFDVQCRIRIRHSILSPSIMIRESNRRNNSKGSQSLISAIWKLFNRGDWSYWTNITWLLRFKFFVSSRNDQSTWHLTYTYQFRSLFTYQKTPNQNVCLRAVG